MINRKKKLDPLVASDAMMIRKGYKWEHEVYDWVPQPFGKTDIIIGSIILLPVLFILGLGIAACF